MRLFDTHCHFDFEVFSQDFEAQLTQAHDSGVERFVIPSIGLSNWQTVSMLSSQYTSIYHALGLHPYFLNAQSEDHLPILEEKLAERSMKCVAVGECGLDAMIDVPAELQEHLFLAQIELAKRYKLPLILHARKTHNRLLQLLKEARFNNGGVLHGFAGSYQQAMQFVEMGFYIGVGGVITYPRANKTRQAVTQIPLKNLVLETDAPDMPLNGHQGKSNHPKMIGEILSCLASLKQESEQTIAENVWNNSNLAFGICE
ncbi:TatD family deoxyribonuclease [Vibrio sp. RE86]|uniref:TatD family hydrolase n=1 Tax=Vibrio sp. RE86 TaxID=2607605 RepID=UPI00149340D1|nr:TatD family deoxyribonuclease [Vibrio sp. RE86]